MDELIVGKYYKLKEWAEGKYVMMVYVGKALDVVMHFTGGGSTFTSDISYPKGMNWQIVNIENNELTEEDL